MSACADGVCGVRMPQCAGEAPRSLRGFPQSLRRVHSLPRGWPKHPLLQAIPYSLFPVPYSLPLPFTDAG
jgi:hypothetical protein